MTRTDLIPETILACCVLHNVCRDHENDAAIANYILDGQINHNVNNNDEVHDDEENAEDEEGIAKRDYSSYNTSLQLRRTYGIMFSKVLRLFYSFMSCSFYNISNLFCTILY